MLRGVKCNICGELGNHYASSCPLRNTVGVPVGLRKEDGAAPAVDGDTAELDDKDVYLSRDELTTLIRKRPEVPHFLRCRACLILPNDAMWCQCCDVFVCNDCLGPPGSDWICPQCECSDVDNFHVIAAMRVLIKAWFEAQAEMV